MHRTWDEFARLCQQTAGQTWHAVSQVVEQPMHAIHQWAVDDQVPLEAFEKLSQSVEKPQRQCA